MTPIYRMPSPERRWQQAAVAEIHDALCAARCCAKLAGMEADEFVVRELLLAVVEQIDRARTALRRFCSTSSR